jgi:hypothetical protein
MPFVKWCREVGGSPVRKSFLPVYDTGHSPLVVTIPVGPQILNLHLRYAPTQVLFSTWADGPSARDGWSSACFAGFSLSSIPIGSCMPLVSSFFYASRDANASLDDKFTPPYSTHTESILGQIQRLRRMPTPILPLLSEELGLNLRRSGVHR